MRALWAIKPCSNFAYSLCGTHHLLSSASTEWMVTQKFTFSGYCAGKGEGAHRYPESHWNRLGLSQQTGKPGEQFSWALVHFQNNALVEKCDSFMRSRVGYGCVFSTWKLCCGEGLLFPFHLWALQESWKGCFLVFLARICGDRKRVMVLNWKRAGVC